VDDAAIRDGLRHVDWPGRLQVLRSAPWLVLDGAHNAASADVVRRALDQHFPTQTVTVVLGLTAGKDAHGVLEALAPRVRRLRLTRSRHERSADPLELEQLARGLMPNVEVSIQPNLEIAVGEALDQAAHDELVLVTGSLFLVGEALVWWRRSPR
jgi:dihydrofolate synthase/folylpolyglutamate synthase